MYRQDFHLQTLTCLAIAISPLCKLVPHWFGFCVRFLKNFNSLQTWSFICCNSWTHTDVHTARHQIWDTVSAGTFRLGLSGLKKPCSFNSILVVTNPNFLHELAPLYVQTGFPSSDIDMSRHCDFSIMQACSALIWILRQISQDFQFFTDLEFYLLQFLNTHWCPHCQASDLGHCIRRNLPSWFERAQNAMLI